MGFEGAGAEALDGGEDVGGLGPAERFGGGVVGVEIGVDRGFEIRGGAMDAAAQGLLREQGEQATWLSQDAEVGVKWTCQRGRLANPSRISLVLCVATLSITIWTARAAHPRLQAARHHLAVRGARS